MYKLLIADDEAVEREALEDLAHVLFKDQFDIALAENGRSAVDIAAAFAPDIIIMDIKMPRMNGIDAARLIREKYPDCKVIMLTGFTYFNYARDSVSLGAVDFLVKPASDETVEKALKTAMKSVDLLRESSVHTAEADPFGGAGYLESELVSEIVFAGVDKQTLQSMITELYPDVQFGIAVVITLKSSESFVLSGSGAVSKCREFCIAAVQRRGAHGLYAPSCRRLDKLYVALLSNSCHDQGYYNGFIKELLSVFHENGITAGASFGSLSQDIARLPMGFIEAQSVKLPANDAIGWFSADILRSERFGSQSTQERLLCEHLEQKQFDESHLLLEHMLNAIIAENDRTAVRIYELIVILNRKALEKVSVPPCYPLWERLLALSGPEDRKQFALHYLQKIIDRLITDEAAYNNTWPQEIVEYIKAEYKNNITLEDAARRVGFSTYYFSRLFKQKFDKSFIEYLTQMRIQNAKQLLSTPGISVKNVCYSVGYSEPNYFARVFKRETGMSPSKFQKKALNFDECLLKRGDAHE